MVPSNGLKSPALDALERSFESIRMLVLHVALHAFGAKFSLVERKRLPRLKPHDLIVAYTQLNATLLATEAAVGLH
jgi:hypothetical protein